MRAAELKTTISLESWKAKFLLDNGLARKTMLYKVALYVNRYLCA